jgi:hypothetical protein
MSERDNDDKHYFSTKGKNAEQVLHDLAKKTFLADWCFLNPCLPDGKELCDLLIVFHDVAIIWQIKDLKLRAGVANRREIDKNIRQLSGARRQLFDLKVPNNPRRKKDVFNPSSITTVHLISALMGEEDGATQRDAIINGQFIHVFTKSFLPDLLKELDTVRDFCQYLEAREAVVKSGMKKFASREQDILAYYLIHDSSFDSNDNLIERSSGLWEQFQESSAYQRKKEADEISYYWDGIIDRVHECRDNPPFPEDTERVARLMAWPNRFFRRRLGNAFAEAHLLADSIPPTQKIDPVRFIRVVPTPFDVTYCFLFYETVPNDNSSREVRLLMLRALCHVVRGIYQSSRNVVGIGTDMTMKEEEAFDFVGLGYSFWTSDDERLFERYQQTYAFLLDTHISFHQDEEYPSETTEP